MKVEYKKPIMKGVVLKQRLGKRNGFASQKLEWKKAKIGKSKNGHEPAMLEDNAEMTESKPERNNRRLVNTD